MFYVALFKNNDIFSQREKCLQMAPLYPEKQINKREILKSTLNYSREEKGSNVLTRVALSVFRQKKLSTDGFTEVQNSPFPSCQREPEGQPKTKTIKLAV